ncbi:citryl-CoA lyase [Devosia sp. MC521]|uniref:citryl-CoA lyase n=1 Tax=Devosia sp. MC521 TaxID=2759954 RepID=UPI0015FDEA9C|nr:citryl-CoA lyase [Devosia sp. MC521]MBJ6988430.1 citryl-CoA lyase [Devosia sp. MC521]QMW62475.1 citryl-CoA lyase [Devosia sp. MC521]
MTDKTVSAERGKAQDWWSTEIIRMEPGQIELRGYPIEQLIGSISYPQMVWLMLRGDLPSPDQAKLLEAAMVAGVDHGPQAPSIAIARMASSCGTGLNGAMASAINVLDDVHGGAGEQAAEIFEAIRQAILAGQSLDAATEEHLQKRFAAGQKFVPGYGHRFHPVDPRATKLLAILQSAAEAGVVDAVYAKIAVAVEDCIAKTKSKRIPLNIDGVTAAIYASLGFPPSLCRGLFILSRSIGILAHAYEESQSTYRNKGPLPKEWLWTYSGTPRRDA